MLHETYSVYILFFCEIKGQNVKNSRIITIVLFIEQLTKLLGRRRPGSPYRPFARNLDLKVSD
jgi:hypothetical protein